MYKKFVTIKNKEFLKLSQRKQENLLMEMAMMIMSMFDDMVYAHQLNPDKVDYDDPIERLRKFSDWAREFEEEYCGTEEYENDCIFLIDEWVQKRLKEEYGDENRINVFYTGGGIWLSEKDLGNGTYAVLNNEWKCLSVFKYAEEKYMPKDMLFSKDVEELNKEEKKLYDELMSELKKRIG